MVVSNKEVLTKITYYENCEYESSTITKPLTLPRQNVQVSIDITNLNANDKNYYTDIIRCTATVTLPTGSGNTGAPIKTGRIEFYYQIDNTTVRKLLNNPTSESLTCLLNNQGKAAIDIQPKDSGNIIAVYVDDNDNYIQENEAIQHIEMHDMPVQINFTKAPPYIANVEDEIELEVQVKDINNNKVNYGLVTFLHYNIKNEDINNPEKRVERVIGNPVIVEDGKAKIKYIPVQTDNHDIKNGNNSIDLEPEHLDVYGEERYIERIRAVYNYDNELYGRKWKYYAQDSVWTDIAIARRNSITIGIDDSSLNIDFEHSYKENETITVKAFLHDKNNDNIHFTESDTANVTFHITGTHSHPNTVPTLNDTTYAQDVTSISYTKNVKCTNIVTDNDITYFLYQLPRLLPGRYTITASADDYNIDKQKDTYGNDNDIYYNIVDDSNELLINIGYEDVSYNIDVNDVNVKTSSAFKIQGIININHNSSNTINSILDGKECYFHIPAIDKFIKGQIKYENAQLKVVSNDIKINISGEYKIYVYIAHGIYSSNLMTTSYHSKHVDFYLNHIEGQCIAHITDYINLEVEGVFVDNNRAPCEVNYSLTGHNISKEVTVSLYYKRKDIADTNHLISNSIILTKDLPTNTGFMGIFDSGNYEITAITSTNQTFKSNFVVESDTLQQILATNEVEMGIYKTIGVYLKGTNKINTIDYNKISAYVQKANSNYNKNNATQVAIQNIKVKDDNTLYLSVFTDTDTDGEYWLSISYAGDDTFSPIDCQAQKFITYTYAPVIDLTISSQGSYGIQVCYYDKNGKKHYPNEVLLLNLDFVANHEVINQGLLLTNNKGYGEIQMKNSNIVQEEWWSAWNRLLIGFTPNSDFLINIAYNKCDETAIYNEGFQYYTIWDEEMEDTLKTQLQNYNNRYIYGTLCRNCTKTISRLWKNMAQ